MEAEERRGWEELRNSKEWKESEFEEFERQSDIWYSVINDFKEGLLFPYVSTFFTWTNNRTWERLDRILYTSSWLDLFDHTSVVHQLRSCSDHRLLEVTLSQSSRKGPSPFRFQNCWAQHPGFLELAAGVLAGTNTSHGYLESPAKTVPNEIPVETVE